MLGSLSGSRVNADEIPKEYRASIRKGLDWLAAQQVRDGHWEAQGGQYPSAMTGLSGMALLMEGSTLREGRYSEKLRRAVDWLMDRSQRNGLLANPNNASESGRYMYGHGFGLLFLAQVYGEEEDGDRRRKLEDILTRAVTFVGKAQSSRGGWYYTSAADGHDMDEGSVTVTQVQALRAAKNAGIVVPKSIIDKAVKYLENSTTESGGVIYSLGSGRRTSGRWRSAGAHGSGFGVRTERRRILGSLDQALAEVLPGTYSNGQHAALSARRIYAILFRSMSLHAR